MWKRLQAGSVLFVSLSWFPVQLLRPTSASWDGAKGWEGGRGALVPAQAFPARSALALHVVGPRPGGSWLAAAWHHPRPAEPCRSALPSVSWLSCKGRDEPNSTELLQQATCQDLQVTASWAQEDWLPVPRHCCSRSWGGTSDVLTAQAGRLKRPRLLGERVPVQRPVHPTWLVHVVPVCFTRLLL